MTSMQLGPPAARPMTDLRGLVKTIVDAGLAAVAPGAAFHRHVALVGDVLTAGDRQYDLSAYDRVLVIGAGKATAAIGRELELLLGDRLAGGCLVLRPADLTRHLRRLTVIHADHPVPSPRSHVGAQVLLDLVSGVTEKDLVIACFTGGSSALVSIPVPGVPAEAKAELHELLLDSGARIQDVNAVRKNVSLIKGGRLAALGSRATWINLTVSDVVGDELQYITDPTVRSGDSPAKAISVLQRLGLWNRVHASIREHLLNDAQEPPQLDAIDVHTVLLATGAHAIEAMSLAARELGVAVVSLGSDVEGEAHEVGRRLAELASSLAAEGRRIAVLAAGGEVTVAGAHGADPGGPNQELAVAFACSLPDGVPVAAAFMDSDGFDGPTAHAGGLVDGSSADRAAAAGVDLRAALEQHATSAALDAIGDLLTTGATGTNISDLMVIVVAPGQPDLGGRRD